MKKVAAVLTALLLLGQPAAAECLITGEAYRIGASAAVVIDAESGEVLFAQEPHRRLPMASTTKIMTAWLALEQPDLYQEFTVDANALQVEGSSMGLQAGDTVTLYALAVGMLLASGNDAAGGAAVRICGSTQAFAKEMNRRASSLGMNNTNFVTPSGLDADEHYSTAYDMALLARAALQNPLFAEIAASRRMTVRYGQPPYDHRLMSQNRLYQKSRTVSCFGCTAGRCTADLRDAELPRRLEHPHDAVRAVFFLDRKPSADNGFDHTAGGGRCPNGTAGNRTGAADLYRHQGGRMGYRPDSLS